MVAKISRFIKVLLPKCKYAEIRQSMNLSIICCICKEGTGSCSLSNISINKSCDQNGC